MRKRLRLIGLLLLFASAFALALRPECQELIDEYHECQAAEECDAEDILAILDEMLDECY